MRQIRHMFYVFSALLLLSLAACSKRTETPAGKTLLDSALLAKVPSSSAAFLVWDTQRPSYQKFKASQWGAIASNRLEDWIAKVPAGVKQENVQALIKVFQTAGLTPSAPGQPETVREGVAFAGINEQKNTPEFGVFLNAAPGTDFSGKLSALESVFKAENFEVRRETIGSQPAFSIKFSQEHAIALSVDRVFFTASTQLMSFASSPELALLPFGEASSGAVQRIKGSNEFSRVAASLAPADEQYMLGYVDIKYLIARLSPLLKETTQEFKPDDIPLDAAVMTNSMGAAPYSLAAFLISPRSEAQKRWVAPLAAAKGGKLLGGLPASASIGISLDGRVLAGFRDAALSDMPAEQQAPLKAQLALLDSVKALSLGVLNSSPVSPFPGVVIVFDSASPAELLSAAQEQVQILAQVSGMPLSPWQTKEIDGISANFLQSPMVGLGVYLGVAGEAVVLASSEEAFKEALTASKASLLSGLPSESKETLSEASPLAGGYGNFEKIGAMVESVQGSMAAFTGGQSSLAGGTLETLKKSGTLLVALNYKEGILKIRSSYGPAPASR